MLILNFFSCELCAENGLPRVSLLYLLPVADKVPYNEVQKQFFSDVSSSRQNLMVGDHKEVI